MTYSGGLAAIYINGQLEGFCGVPHPPTAPSQDLLIGGVISTELEARMDELRIWDAPLSESQLAAGVACEVDGTEAGLVGYWKFDEIASEQTVFDESPLGNHGFLGPQPWFGLGDPRRVVAPTCPEIPSQPGDGV